MATFGFTAKAKLGIIGPFFFENEQGEDVTVNGDRYRAMLNEFLFTSKQAKLSHLDHRKPARRTQNELLFGADFCPEA